jgi:hypothetical protein
MNTSGSDWLMMTVVVIAHELEKMKSIAYVHGSRNPMAEEFVNWSE